MTAKHLVLAGDVGGTNARMSFLEIEARPGPAEPLLREAWSRTYPSPAFPGLEAIVAQALIDSGLRAAAATFGVAGPVIGDSCRTTNLPWEIEAATVAAAAGLAHVGLLNDLQASAWGLAAMPPDRIATIHAGAGDATGTQALIAAGTGLGEAFLAWDGARHVVGASEGGHCSFAPGNDEEDALLGYLRDRHDQGHVSWERVVSGPGLALLPQFLGETGRDALPEALRLRISEDGPVAVTEAAGLGVPIAMRALRLFVRLLGAEAGNLALKVLSSGGMFIGGGIAPRIRPWIEEPAFLEAFLAKGRMRPVLERMPVRLLLDDRAAVLGAARHAMLAASSRA